MRLWSFNSTHVKHAHLEAQNLTELVVFRNKQPGEKLQTRVAHLSISNSITFHIVNNFMAYYSHLGALIGLLLTVWFFIKHMHRVSTNTTVRNSVSLKYLLCWVRLKKILFHTFKNQKWHSDLQQVKKTKLLDVKSIQDVCYSWCTSSFSFKIMVILYINVYLLLIFCIYRKNQCPHHASDNLSDVFYWTNWTVFHTSGDWQCKDLALMLYILVLLRIHKNGFSYFNAILNLM